MRNARLLAALAVASLGQRCAANTQQSARPAAVDPLAQRPPEPPAHAALDAVAADAATADAPAAAALTQAIVTPVPILREATAQDRWSTVATLSALGSRDALSAHVRAVAQRRIAAMSPEERRDALRWHRARISGRDVDEEGALGVGFGALGAPAGASSTTRAPARSSAASAPRSPRPRSNSITNNQVANVDEGDIVKASGDDLIILRRGHLFRVSTANNALRRVGHAPAFAPGTRPGDWYDELLVDGDIALVLGYSYRANATEVNRFRLERSGAIRYLDSFYVRSQDYYSSENYATRLVDGRFVVYVPMELQHEDLWERRFRLPSVRIGRRGAFREPFSYSNVFVTAAHRDASTLHTVLRCDVHAPRVSCSAQGVMGGSSRSFYVSSSAVYVWTEGADSEAPSGDPPRGSWIVRLPLSEQHRPGAAVVRGAPVDQFAFDERGQALHLLLREDGRGDAMWSAERSGGGVAAVKIPLSRLDGAVSQAPAEAYSVLVSMPRGAFKERWIGDYALFGRGSDAYGYEPVRPGMASRFFAYRASDQRLFEVQTDYVIERIEPLGAHALAVGSNAQGLVLTPVALDGASPTTREALRLPGRSQGETRSHGFFFNPSGPREGVFGVATANAINGVGTRFDGASDVSFFRVERLALSSIGTVESLARALVGRCIVSCADWYGNTRPIFWGDRVFALMGDELVEAQLARRSLTERTRLDYGEGVETVVADEPEESPF